MKRMLPLFALTLLVCGCHHMHKQVVGSGVRQLQTRDLRPFTSISTEGAFDIQVVCQKPQQVEIEGDDNILPLITTEVSDNVLHIRNLRNYYAHDGVTVKINVPNLDGLSAKGAGKIEVAGMKNDRFEVDTTGAPVVKITGDTKVLEIKATGAGSVDAHKLLAARAIVDSKGVAKVEVHATDELKVTVSGPSHVIYDGNPMVSKTVNGPGSVEKREGTGA